MSKFMQELGKKFVINMRFDYLFLRSSNIPLFERGNYFLRKYYSILNNKRQISYLGDIFHYDNRLAPAVLQIYPAEISDLNKTVDLKNLKNVLDIGANIGQFSYTLKKFYPHLSIYSFEPNKEAYALLKKNFEKSDATYLFNYGIANETGKRTFYYSPSVSAEGSLVKENMNQNYVKTDVKEISIDVVKLDKNNLQKLKMPSEFDLVKIDVEGAEVEVINSLKDINFKFLEIEVSTNRKGEGNLDNISALLEKVKGVKPKLVYYNPLGKDSPAANAIFQLGN